MQPNHHAPSRLKVALTWVLTLSGLLVVISLGTWFVWNRPPDGDAAPEPDVFHSIVMLVIGVSVVLAGIAAYVIAVFTDCFTFTFNRPIWKDLKGRLYLANIFIPILPAVGVGLAVSAFLRPVLNSMGLPAGLSSFLPLLGVIFLLQIVQLWVLIWAPVERRIITKRLMARGITPAQLQNAFLVGTSDPTRSSFKKLGMVEEDLGGLWVGPGQLIYWGDADQFAVGRDQLIGWERKADAGSTTMLGGIAHVILHFRQADGSERTIRLHIEGVWTMGTKRRGMDALAEAVAHWQNAPAVAIPV